MKKKHDILNVVTCISFKILCLVLITQVQNFPGNLCLVFWWFYNEVVRTNLGSTNFKCSKVPSY